MKNVLFILLLLFQRHEHVSTGAVKTFYDPKMYRDTTTLSVNVITYVLKNDSCGLCNKWYKIRQNVDTFSTRRTARYSNIKYPKKQR